MKVTFIKVTLKSDLLKINVTHNTMHWDTKKTEHDIKRTLKLFDLFRQFKI